MSCKVFVQHTDIRTPNIQTLDIDWNSFSISAELLRGNTQREDCKTSVSGVLERPFHSTSLKRKLLLYAVRLCSFSRFKGSAAQRKKEKVIFYLKVYLIASFCLFAFICHIWLHVLLFTKTMEEKVQNEIRQKYKLNRFIETE